MFLCQLQWCRPLLLEAACLHVSMSLISMSLLLSLLLTSDKNGFVEVCFKVISHHLSRRYFCPHQTKLWKYPSFLKGSPGMMKFKRDFCRLNCTSSHNSLICLLSSPQKYSPTFTDGFLPGKSLKYLILAGDKNWPTVSHRHYTDTLQYTVYTLQPYKLYS